MTAPILFSITGYGCFEEMYRSERDLVYGAVFCKVRENAAAEDLTQETFLRVLQKWDKYVPQKQKDPKESFRSWLGTIAKNLALNHLAKTGREQACRDGISISNRSGGKSYETNFSPSQRNEKSYCRGLSHKMQNPFTPLELVLQKRMVESIDEVLEGLPYLDTAKLYLLEGFRCREIAELKDIPEGTVMSGLDRARKRLQHSGKYL